MNLLAWMLFGLITGIIAHEIDPSPNQGGLLGSILLGVVGAFVGGLVSDLLFGISITGFNLTSFLIAIVGSLGVLFIGRAMRRV